MFLVKQSKRQYRRSHRDRLVKARRDYWGWQDLVKNKDPRRSGKIVATAAVCSCAMCGNPRKYFTGKKSLTIRELSDNEALAFED